MIVSNRSCVDHADPPLTPSSLAASGWRSQLAVAAQHRCIIIIIIMLIIIYYHYYYYHHYY